eukprot:m51a1_g357 hypothetical protein (484) ;mRNA; f:581092-582856
MTYRETRDFGISNLYGTFTNGPQFGKMHMFAANLSPEGVLSRMTAAIEAAPLSPWRPPDIGKAEAGEIVRGWYDDELADRGPQQDVLPPAREVKAEEPQRQRPQRPRARAEAEQEQTVPCRVVLREGRASISRVQAAAGKVAATSSGGTKITITATLGKDKDKEHHHHHHHHQRQAQQASGDDAGTGGGSDDEQEEGEVRDDDDDGKRHKTTPVHLQLQQPAAHTPTTTHAPSPPTPRQPGSATEAPPYKRQRHANDTPPHAAAAPVVPQSVSNHVSRGTDLKKEADRHRSMLKTERDLGTSRARELTKKASCCYLCAIEEFVAAIEGSVDPSSTIKLCSSTADLAEWCARQKMSFVSIFFKCMAVLHQRAFYEHYRIVDRAQRSSRSSHGSSAPYKPPDDLPMSPMEHYRKAQAAWQSSEREVDRPAAPFDWGSAFPPFGPPDLSVVRAWMRRCLPDDLVRSACAAVPPSKTQSSSHSSSTR